MNNLIDYDHLNRLYTSYGFQVSKETTELPVFLYEKGRYFGVDIILVDSDLAKLKTAEQIKEKYAHIGYAVNLKSVRSNNEAEIELFKSFFSFDSSMARLRKKYEDFCKKQAKNLFDHPYQYVESPFEVQNEQNPQAGIFDLIQHYFKSDKAELLIIEAAAGYGKTCTAFEVLHHITRQPSNQIPMFTELARNRSANIFKYILLDEINIEYPTLNLELVTKEIKNGRIPLIIDGFDELIIKTDIDSETNDLFGEVESMLDTIGNLLEHKTKIILTTRKTAIFTGIEFENWVAKWSDKFRLTRLSIGEPRIQDWLGARKFECIQQRGVPIESLANPVLLTFLKHLDEDYFNTLMTQPDVLIDHYFEKMLEREQIRQNLIMPVETQLRIFKNITKMMVAFDISVEEKEFFKQIIIETNRKQLEYTRNLYSATERPSLESLVDTLANHALLDRKGRDQNQVGFINEFVFGIFIGEILIEYEAEELEKEVSKYMVELAVTAYRVHNSYAKTQLWNKLVPLFSRFTTSAVFTFDIYLRGSLQRNFEEVGIYDLSFINADFTDHAISNSVFINCHFRQCHFSAEELYSTSFINCHFVQCRVNDAIFIDERNGVTVIKCSQEDCSILIEETSHYNGKPEIVTELEKAILERIWKISNTRGHHILQLMQHFNVQQKRKVDSALKTLEEKGYIKLSGRYIHYEMNRLHTIKEILGIQ